MIGSQKFAMLSPAESAASLNPTFQLIAKRKVDELQVLKVFNFVDSVVHHVIARLLQIIEK